MNLCNIGARDPESIGILEIGDRIGRFLNSYENRRGASVESRMRAAHRSERILQAGRRKVAASQPKEKGGESEQENVGTVPQGQRRKPASWGKSLYEREAEKKEEKTVLTKAERRRNVPEERLEFLRQNQQRKRQRWGDPVSCGGFETRQTKRLKATLLDLTVGEFIGLQGWLSLEEKCKMTLLGSDFEKIMGGKGEKDSLVARWRIKEDIKKASDKMLSWAWQNDVPWYGQPADEWKEPEGSNFCEAGAENEGLEEAAEEVPLLEPGEIDILDIIIKDEDLCPATEQDFLADMQLLEEDMIVKKEDEILCPAGAQCDAADVQLFESVFKKGVCVCPTEEEIALGERQLEIHNLLNREILEGPPQIKFEEGDMDAEEDRWISLPTPIFDYLEANFLPLREIVVFRLISKSMMRCW